MEESIANIINVAIDEGQILLVPLAAAGLAAWVSPFVDDRKIKTVMKFVNMLGGNVGKAKNDPVAQDSKK